MSSGHPYFSPKSVAMLLTGVIWVAALGYFVGIYNNLNYGHYAQVVPPPPDDEAPAVAGETSLAIPALNYAEMRRRESGPTSLGRPSWEQVPPDNDFQHCITCHDPHSAAVQPSEEDKRRSLATRAARRAFNGAPPVIPHAVEQTDDAACYACHGSGARIGERVANRMSHGFLVNCLQCHAAPPPQAFAHLEGTTANLFAGMPAPLSGERAFPGAPPAIPHSTWMRERCLSCHGGGAGWPGLAVTHRWRADCTQCHVTSAQLEQAVVADASGGGAFPTIHQP